MKITALNIYPIKSLPGISLSESYTQEMGLAHDRKYMLVDAQGRFISQREYPSLTLFNVSLHKGGLIIQHPSNKKSLRIQSQDFSDKRIPVQIWDDTVNAALPKENYINEWFSQRIGQDVRLVYMDEEALRMKTTDRHPTSSKVSFADGYPYLLANQASLRALNEKLNTPIPMNRFRANIIVDGFEAFEEDHWKSIKIGEAEFACIKPCARCIVINTDQSTGEKGVEPLKTLSTFRKEGNKVLFGENMFLVKAGKISLGDSVEVLERKV